MTLTVSGFASDAFSFACSGLPAKAQCIFDTVVGSQSYGTTTLQVVTDGGLSAKANTNVRGSSSRASGVVVVALIPGLLAFFGLARRRRKAVLSWLSMLFFALVLVGGLLTGCGSGSTTTTTTSTDVTPTGTSTVTVTATAGDQHATVNFTLQVQ
jgi:cytochrome bd-type quinol oxidase subunit 2